MKRLVIGLVVFAVSLAAVLSTRLYGPTSIVYQEIAPVRQGEYLTVHAGVDEYIYVFGFRVMKTSQEIRIIGVDVRDLESGKLIGKLHVAGDEICQRCKGTGEEP